MLAGLSLPAFADFPVLLVPQPKKAVFADAAPLHIEPATAAIVVGAGASEPERYAAELLQAAVERRFGQRWAIVAENEDRSRFGVLFFLGKPEGCRAVNELAQKLNISLAEKAPGVDAYYIRMAEVEGKPAAFILGTNGRSVIYGQDTLFQLLEKRDGRLVLHRAQIDDWASIPWRGRPQTSASAHFVPGRFESYAVGRLNWTDLREGQYAYAPGARINVEQTARLVKEARRRGMFLYAAVNCAVRPADFDAVIKTYEELIALGAEGLYISIDDPGAEFRFGTPDELIKRVIELGRRHGITGWKIGIVPGKVSYSNILTDVNRRVAKIPGMDEALWFWTVTPSKQALEDARSIGLKSRPAWWHNWPRPNGGITYTYYGGSRRANGAHAYMGIAPLSAGWGNASYGDLAAAAWCTDAVMPWGGSEWGSEYNSFALGWWAWAPELHDWKAVRTRAYDIVFGPDQVADAFAFDDMLQELESLFWRDTEKSQRNRLPYLLSLSARPRALEIIAKMKEALARIESGAPGQTLIPNEALNEYYLEPMRAVVDIGRRLAEIDLPEYWWDAHEQRVLTAAREARFDQIQQWNAKAKQRVTSEVYHAREVLQGSLSNLNGYVRFWLSRFDPLDIVPVAAEGPALKGDLSDPLWKQGLKITRFTQGGELPRDPTDAFILASNTDLYVGFVCHEQRMERLRTEHTARDSEVWMDDSVEIFVNPDLLGDAVYQIVVNPDGAVADSRGTGGRPGDRGWDANADVKTWRGDDRWCAEVRIPLEELGMSGSPRGAILRMNLARNDFAGPFAGYDVPGACDRSSWTGQHNLHDAGEMKTVVFEE